MSWYLQFDGSNDNVTFATAISIPANNSDSFAYVWDFYYDGTADQVLFANPSSFNDSVRISSSTEIIFRAGASSRSFTLSTALVVGRQILKLKKNGFSGNFYDGSNNALSSDQSFGAINTVYGFGAESVSSRKFSGRLYSAQIYSDFAETTLEHDWNSTASGGTGTTLPNSQTSNDGTLNNFTGTTNSWWVFFGAAGVTIPVIMAHLRNQGIS
jgi:hypothetical protein